MRKDELYSTALERESSRSIVRLILKEINQLRIILQSAQTKKEARLGVQKWVLEEEKSSPGLLKFRRGRHQGGKVLASLDWRDIAAVRLLDYVDNADRRFTDDNLQGDSVESDPIGWLWQAIQGDPDVASPAFFLDMLHLFRQFSNRGDHTSPSRARVKNWMVNYPSGLDSRIVELRKENRDRILGKLVQKIERGEIRDRRFFFEPGMSPKEKLRRAREWWEDKNFHLRFALRSPELLNELLDDTLSDQTMKTLFRAREKGIPFFINPYYLSLLNVHAPRFARQADLAIKDYIIYSKELVDAFGDIRAWEKEDLVEPGKPNAAGWLLPSGVNIHRRYPKVAILIPDTEGRACAGLCAPCQRMYGFQQGRLNFEVQKLRVRESWQDKLSKLMNYFETDSKLRDILITGGDALMNSDSTLSELLDAVYEMARRKKAANAKRGPKNKLAEIRRVRLGTRLPVYLPQRITRDLVEILAEFKHRASQIGISQFIIQTHFESPMEVTPEAKKAVSMLLAAGWVVTNQAVFTAAASRRGHMAKLRAVLGEIGVLPYYTFAVKGFRENHHNAVPAARLVQEIEEEKSQGTISEDARRHLAELPSKTHMMPAAIKKIRKMAKVPFLSTDRNIVNLPGLGKSLTFRVVGITRDGRRILEFNHDPGRMHSPIIENMDKVVIVQSKSIAEYLAQLEKMGENLSEYESIYGYSLGETEPKMPLYEYPCYDFEVTDEITNFQSPYEQHIRTA